MPQGVLPFQIEGERKTTKLTALGGLMVYLELLAQMKFGRLVERHVRVRDGEQGWADLQVVTALTLLNLAGGDSVSDLRVLEDDEGFSAVFRRVEGHELSRRERRALERRQRGARTQTFPSDSAVFRYLGAFHDETEEERRRAGEAFIPAPTAGLRGLYRVNAKVLEFVQRNRSESVATLDQDATLVETTKREAQYCYQGFAAYQPQNVFWAEQDLLVFSEFRDGNVPAGFEQKRVFRQALSMLPQGVEKVRLRSDSAGYQVELLRYCAEGQDERFGVIEFAIACPVTPEFKDAASAVAEADWQPLRREVRGEEVDTGQEWAEVCFVPNSLSTRKGGPTYRFIAIRERLRQLDLPGLGETELPVPTATLGGVRYKLTGLVTNRDLPGPEVIWWHRERCGKSEAVHAVLKDDLAGGRMPSGKFGANAAWWAIAVLAHNLHVAMKRLVLDPSWTRKRLKAIRFGLVHIAGRVIHHGRRLILRVSGNGHLLERLLELRRRIGALAQPPPA